MDEQNEKFRDSEASVFDRMAKDSEYCEMIADVAARYVVLHKLRKCSSADVAETLRQFPIEIWLNYTIEEVSNELRTDLSALKAIARHEGLKFRKHPPDRVAN